MLDADNLARDALQKIQRQDTQVSRQGEEWKKKGRGGKLEQVS